MLCVWLVAAGCGDTDRPVPGRVEPSPPTPPAAAATSHRDALQQLFDFEESEREATDFAAQPPSNRTMGPDPYAIAALGGPAPRFVGTLRGADAIVVLDARGHTLATAKAPASPTGLAVTADGDVFAVGLYGAEIAHLRVEANTAGDADASATATALARRSTLPLDGVLAPRAIAVGPRDGDAQVLYVVEEHRGRLLAVRARRSPGPTQTQTALTVAEQREIGRCHGPIDVRYWPGFVVVNCLLDRSLAIYPVDARGRPAGDAHRITHDGPLWSFDALPEPDGRGLLVVAGGVQDHPLVRVDTGFRYMDSYVFAYRVRRRDDAVTAERVAEIDVSARGVITPKWIHLVRDADTVIAQTSGYGGDALLTLTWTDAALADRSAPAVATRPIAPGARAAAAAPDGALAIANPLLDAWVIAPAQPPADAAANAAAIIGVPPVPGAPPRQIEARVGELLFFTKMMAPWNRADGPLSRFTCETCHFEGYIDGRIHYTGRGDVHVVTKPLLGLFNNRPHFSRALDPTMTGMVHAEFRVANKDSGRDSWFALQRASFPWLSVVDGVPPTMEPEYLRRSLMRFLMQFSHRPNPAVARRARFTDAERRGAELFAARCESCHQARLSTDEPDSRVPFERWEALVLAPEGAIVWAVDEYKKTGITPYVHERGTRVPSLRRLYKKYPYFTNGSSPDLTSAIERARFSGDRFYHDASAATATGAAEADPAELEQLTPDEVSAIAAFLGLL